MRERVIITVSILLVLTAGMAYAASIVGTRHDLSTAITPEPCVFCHIPHRSDPATAPLWNRSLGAVTFQVYTSPTMNTTCSNPPTGISLACMSCHDGINAPYYYGSYTLSDKHDLLNDPNGGRPDTSSYPNCERCHPEFYSGQPVQWFKTGTTADLTREHPVSMPYPTAAIDPDFYTPPDTQKGWPDVKLYAGRVECASCHDPHDPAISPFLRKAKNTLCSTCHTK